MFASLSGCSGAQVIRWPHVNRTKILLLERYVKRLAELRRGRRLARAGNFQYNALSSLFKRTELPAFGMSLRSCHRKVEFLARVL